MSAEEQSLEQTDAYAGLLDNFGSEIGSTLEDLASYWDDTDYDFRENVENIPTRRATVPVSASASRSLHQARGSMDEDEGLSDWSLKKARPLAFANPVYDLVNIGGIVTKSHQMKLIPLNQFDINKPHDGGKQGKKGKKGTLMNKLSHFSIRKHHSMRKTEHEMNVTAPLWTDAPAVSRSPVRRSTSLKKPSVTVELRRDTEDEEELEEKEKKEEKPRRPASLEIDKDTEKMAKAPPPKTPRTAKGNFTPNEPSTPKTPNLELPEQQSLSSAVSTSSIASDMSEELEEHTPKTMMEVMHEIEDDSTNQEELTQQKEEQITPDQTPGEDEPLLKRNKTLKWSGSRAAPALIREFTRKSKKSAGQPKQLEIAATDSPEVSAGESPAKSLNGDSEKPDTMETGDSAKNPQIERLQVDGKSSSAPSTPKKRDSSAFTILSSLLPPAPKLRRSESSKIRMYIHRMGTNSQNALGYATTEFVKQTLQSTEHRPLVLLHSIRSFLTDMKKYLITNPHIGFMGKIKKILKNMPIQDVEGAIDDALERLVLYPLRDFIYKRLVIDYASSGKIEMVEESIKLGQAKSPQELGIRATLIPPSGEAMEMVKHHFMELQTTYSPYYKLKHLLSAVTTIYENTSDLTCEDQSARKIGADDFFPLLVHAIVKCDFTAADIEAQYIDGLLDPTLLLGEGGYYLTSLISAVQLLSSMKKRETPLPNITDLQGFLKVGISSKTEKMMESDGVLMHKTLHVPPSMTSHNLGMMIAKKYGIKNVKNFCLHVVVNGVAYPLKPQEFPQLVKMDLLTQFSADSFYFIYRQIEKSPEKPSERPSTIDSEQLKVNTEGGEAVLTANKETEQSSETSSEATSSDSDTATKLKKKVPSLDELPPPDDFTPENIHSPGFADIPLPADILMHQAAMISEAAATASEETPAVVCEEPAATPSSGPAPAPTQAVEEVSNTFTDSTVSVENTAISDEEAAICAVEAAVACGGDMPPPYEEVADPGAELSQEAISTAAVTLPPPEDMSLPIHATPPPPDDLDSPLDVTLTSDGIPPPSQDDLGTPLDVTLTPGGIPPRLELENLPPPPPEDLTSPCVDDQPLSFDTTDAESEDDTLTDETYLSATLVDDVLSPVKKRTAAPPKDVHPILEEAEEEEEEILAEISAPETPKITLKPAGEIPQVTLTDISQSEEELRPGSVLSDVSIGCHSDGYYGGGDGRYSSRGYHSDGHQVDDVDSGAPSESDIAAQTSVSVLKTYFEGKIHQVSEEAARTVSPHSPN